jgi:hypothetical protein
VRELGLRQAGAEDRLRGNDVPVLRELLTV